MFVMQGREPVGEVRAIMVVAVRLRNPPQESTTKQYETTDDHGVGTISAGLVSSVE